MLVCAVRAAACRLPEPPDRYLLTEASSSGDATDIPSVCRIACRPAPPRSPRRLFTLSFDRPAGERDEAWSVFLPRFINGVEVAVNGAVILDSRRHPVANRPDRNTPEIVADPGRAAA